MSTEEEKIRSDPPDRCNGPEVDLRDEVEEPKSEHGTPIGENATTTVVEEHNTDGWIRRQRYTFSLRAWCKIMTSDNLITILYCSETARGKPSGFRQEIAVDTWREHSGMLARKGRKLYSSHARGWNSTLSRRHINSTTLIHGRLVLESGMAIST